MLQAHYRSILDFSNAALLASEKGYRRLMDALELCDFITPTDTTSGLDIEKWKQSCFDAMNDDFNSPILIANLFDAVKFLHQTQDGKASISKKDLKILHTCLNEFVFDVLGLEKTASTSIDQTLSGVVSMLITMRNEAREQKDFATSDRIRDELAAIGVQLKDGKEGTTFSIQ
jgi:cysteinyl-tRNA synthetase